MTREGQVKERDETGRDETGRDEGGIRKGGGMKQERGKQGGGRDQVVRNEGRMEKDRLSVRSKRPLALFDLAGAGHEDRHEFAGFGKQVSNSFRFD
jgi:hypothetical protein